MKMIQISQMKKNITTNMTTVKTNDYIKSFFANNWLALLIIIGLVFGTYYAIERYKEINQKNSDIAMMIQDQREMIERNHDTINQLNENIIAERAAIESLRRDYEGNMQDLRSDLRTQLNNTKTVRTQRINQLLSNPAEIVPSLSNTFGFGND